LVSELGLWIQSARKRGLSYSDISKQLKQQGYSNVERLISLSVSIVKQPEFKIPLLIIAVGFMLVLTGIASHLTYDTTPTVIYPEDQVVPTVDYIEVTPAFNEPIKINDKEADTVIFNITKSGSQDEPIDNDQLNVTIDNQTSKTCAPCQYLYNSTCTAYACCSDLDCADGNSLTVDTCSNATTIDSLCVNEESTIKESNITINATSSPCIDSDAVCPETCTYFTDSDCAITDEIFLNCKESALCYKDEAIKRQQPELCANIGTYWQDTDGKIQGSCYYTIAINTTNCALCANITYADYKITCEFDTCNSS